MTCLSKRGSAPCPALPVPLSPAAALEAPDARRIVRSPAAALGAQRGVPCWDNRVRGGPAELDHPHVSAA